MGKYEFLDSLRACLEGKMTPVEVSENVRYYDDYITNKVRAGQTEEEVMEELGDARFIAKSILASKGMGSSKIMYEETFQEEDDQTDTENIDVGSKIIEGLKSLKPMLIFVAFLLLIIFVLGFVFNVLAVLAPILIPALIVWFIVSIVRSNR